MNYITKIWILIMMLAIMIASDWTPTTVRLNFGLILVIVAVLVFVIDLYLYHK